MAFIRWKKVHGHKYYQAVRSYRDRAGKHRQEVLCHLGKHKSLEAAIDAERKKVKIHRERASLQLIRANALRAKLLDLHGWEFVDGKIPSEAEAARELDVWWPQWEAYFDPNYRRDSYYSGTEYMDVEEADIQVEKYMSCIEYHAASRLAKMADSRADGHQERLDKLLRVQREYF